MSFSSPQYPDQSERCRPAAVPHDPKRPHNTLPVLPPDCQLETTQVLKQCVRSRTEVAKLDQAAEFLPNKALLINIMPLLEAQASSEIENIVTTKDRLFRNSLREVAEDPATREALNYRTALREGFENLKERPLSTGTAERICSVIKGHDIRVRDQHGTALGNPLTGEVIYTPPVGEALLRELLGNWEAFLHAPSDLDPLVVMAVSHYQFEAIHPFDDGNGRTGRVLNLLYLIQTGLLSSPILYLSRGIIRRKAEYYERLRAVTFNHAWESWIIYMLEVIEESAAWTNRKIIEIRNLSRETKTKLQLELPKIYSAELLDVLFNQPYCRIADLVGMGIAKRQAASTYLKQLVRIGLLSEEKVGREKLFIHHAYLELLLNEPPSD